MLKRFKYAIKTIYKNEELQCILLYFSIIAFAMFFVLILSIYPIRTSITILLLYLIYQMTLGYDNKRDL